MPVSAGQDRVASGDVLRSLRTSCLLDVAFVGRVDDHRATFVLDQFDGARTANLRNLVCPTSNGVGGKCITLGRPVSVADYTAARGISHEFDRQVAGEGLRAMFAIPVAGPTGVREIVYGALRRPLSFGERLIDRALGIVDGAVKANRACRDPRPDHIGVAIREVHAELVSIAKDVADPTVRQRLRDLTERLVYLQGGKTHQPNVKLTQRELDVLAEVAMGVATDVWPPGWG